MFYDRFVQLCEQKGMKPSAVAREIGFDKSLITHWKQKGFAPKVELMQRIAEYFGITVDYLLEYETPNNVLEMPKTKKVPRLGKIACGEPIFANEEYGEFDIVPEFVNCDYSLECQGDSMINARINDGDIVFIKSQPDVENGQIAAVIIGDEATLKRVYKSAGTIILQPENPAYEPLVYSGEELQQIRILGKAEWFLSRIK